MATTETLVLDGLSLNDGTTLQLVDGGLDLTPPAKRPEWITGADADGASLVRDPLFENREITVTMRVYQGSMDLALAKVGALVDKLEEAEQQTGGLPLVWTPANSTKSITFYVLSGFIKELPIKKSSVDSGWMRQRPTVTLVLNCKPFGYGAALDTYLDNFSTDTFAAGNWLTDIGSAANVAVAGGVLTCVANPTTENWFAATNLPYDLTDCQLTMKFTVGATLTGTPTFGVRLARQTANTVLQVYANDNGTTSQLFIAKQVGGVFTSLTSVALTRLVAATSYWVRARKEGNVIFAEFWTAAPTATGTPATSTSFTLTGGDIAQFGLGVSGKVGIIWRPGVATATVDDWQVDPHVYVSTAPDVNGALYNVAGDAPAEARLQVTERSAQSRRYLEWGLEQRFFTPAAPAPLILGLPTLVVAGFGGVSSTRAGSFETNVVNAQFDTSPVAICGTGVQSHVGAFRVKARVRAASASGIASDVRVRFSWQDGDGPFASNAWVPAFVYADWIELDLGQVTLSQAKLGTQRWTGRVEVVGTATGASLDVLDLDFLHLVPATEGYGKGRAAYSYLAGSIVGYDKFAGTAAGSPLNARTAPAGGTWATSGSTTDFAFSDNFFVSGSEEITRSTTADTGAGRFGILGSTNYSDCEVGVVAWPAQATSNRANQMVLARWVDANNWVRFQIRTNQPSAFTPGMLTIDQNVAGVLTTIASNTQSVASLAGDAPYSLRLVVYASGLAIATLLNVAGATVAQLSATSTALATGGALQAGKPGIGDFAPASTSGRAYDNFYVAAPAPEPVVLYGGRQMEVRSDDAIRQDSTGTYYGQLPSYRGSLLFLPPAGDKARVSRLMVKADRNDVEAAADVPLGDNLQMRVIYTPRWIAVPQ